MLLCNWLVFFFFLILPLDIVGVLQTWLLLFVFSCDFLSSNLQGRLSIMTCFLNWVHMKFTFSNSSLSWSNHQYLVLNNVLIKIELFPFPTKHLYYCWGWLICCCSSMAVLSSGMFSSTITLHKYAINFSLIILACSLLLMVPSAVNHYLLMALGMPIYLAIVMIY